MSSLEDDVELEDAVQEQPAAPKRKLSRLKRASNVGSAKAVPDELGDAQPDDTTATATAIGDGQDVQAEASGSMGVRAERSDGVSARSIGDSEGGGGDLEDDAAAGNGEGIVAEEDDEDYWDEEDELAVDFQRELVGGSRDITPAPSGTFGGDEDGDGDGGSALSSPAKLNAQTQRMLRDSAVRDRIGKGHAVEIAPLSGILAKLKAQRQAVIARTKPAPVRRRTPTPPLEPAAEAVAEGEDDDDDVLLLSDEEEQPAAPVGAAKAAPATLPRPRAAAPAAAGPVTAPLQESQEELQLNLGTGSEDGRILAAFSQPSLHLMLDSQTQQPSLDCTAAPSPAADAPPAATAAAAAATEQKELAEPGAWAQLANRSKATAVAPTTGAAAETVGAHAATADPPQSGQDHSGNRDGPADGPSSSGVGESDAEDSQDGAGAISGSSSSSSDSSNSDAEDENDSPLGMPGPAQGDEPPANTSELVRRQAAVAAAKAQLRDKPGDFFKSDFFEMEAEMSDDEGHSDDGDDDDANADGMLAELIGEASEKKRDAARREKLHAAWLQAQDATDMEAVVAAMRSGWRRPGRATGLDGDLGTDRDARRRRAALMGITEEELDAADFDIARLFPGARRAADGGGSGDEDEAAEEAAAARDAAAQRLLDASQELEPEAIMDGCSQETLGLLSRGAASRPAVQPAAQRSRLGLFGSELTNVPAGGASFLGRSAPSGSKVVRGGSGEHTNGGGRSYVFGGRDDSNSGMPPPDQPGEVADDAAPRGPTSFTGLRTVAASAAAAAARKSKRKASAPALLGMLSGSKGLSAAAGMHAAGDGGDTARAAASLSRLLGAGSGAKRSRGGGSGARALDSLFRKGPVS